MKYYLYINKRLKSNQYYIGISANPAKRLKEHNSGKVKATKYKRPYKTVFIQAYASKDKAMSVERKIKSWKRKDFIEKIIREKIIKTGV
ncbi:MAG: GIY-YIG nuclease family protein [bacterium]